MFRRDTDTRMEVLRNISRANKDSFGLFMLWYFSTVANQPNKVDWIQRRATRELKTLKIMAGEEWWMELGIVSLEDERLVM